MNIFWVHSFCGVPRCFALEGYERHTTRFHTGKTNVTLLSATDEVIATQVNCNNQSKEEDNYHSKAISLHAEEKSFLELNDCNRDILPSTWA